MIPSTAVEKNVWKRERERDMCYSIAWSKADIFYLSEEGSIRRQFPRFSSYQAIEELDVELGADVHAKKI